MSIKIFAVLLLVTESAVCQFKIDIGEGRELQISQAVQLWDVYSMSYAGSTNIDKRNDIYFRRGRLTVEGKLRSDMSFNFMIAYDGIGKDSLTQTAGTPNPSDNHDLYVWEASWMWMLSPEANITFGYFRPQAGREQMGSEFYVISYDKSLPDVQTRQHLLARSTGRETGINFGGLHLGEGWSLNYNLGLFDPTNRAIVGNRTKWAPLLAARVAATLGDPEMKSYKLTYVQSYYGRRMGTTFGVNVAHQGATEVFTYNGLYGADVLSNYGPMDFNAEYDWMYRNSGTDGRLQTTDRVFSVKIGYGLQVDSIQRVEPTLMYTGERAFLDLFPGGANTLTGSTSKDLYDIGVNWLMNNDKFKINLHYVWGKRYDRAPDENFSYLGFGIQLLY